jgi:hypothetical protein
MAIVWDYSARNRRQKLRKFSPANVTPPKSRDHAVPGLIDKVKPGGVSHCPPSEPPTFSWPEAKHGGLTMQKKFGIAVITALLAAPVAAQAQGISGGMKRVAAEGKPLAARSAGSWAVCLVA